MIKDKTVVKNKMSRFFELLFSETSIPSTFENKAEITPQKWIITKRELPASNKNVVVYSNGDKHMQVAIYDKINQQKKVMILMNLYKQRILILYIQVWHLVLKKKKQEISFLITIMQNLQ